MRFQWWVKWQKTDARIQFRVQKVARDQQIPQPALDQQKRVPVDHIIGRR